MLSSELDLIFRVSAYLVEYDLVYAFALLGHGVSLGINRPALVIEEAVLAGADCYELVDGIFGIGNADTGYGDFLGFGVEGYLDVASGLNHEVIVEVAAVYAVPFLLRFVAADKLDDLDSVVVFACEHKRPQREQRWWAQQWWALRWWAQR